MTTTARYSADVFLLVYPKMHKRLIKKLNKHIAAMPITLKRGYGKHFKVVVEQIENDDYEDNVYDLIGEFLHTTISTENYQKAEMKFFLDTKVTLVDHMVEIDRIRTGLVKVGDVLV